MLNPSSLDDGIYDQLKKDNIPDVPSSLSPMEKAKAVGMVFDSIIPHKTAIIIEGQNIKVLDWRPKVMMPPSIHF